MKYPFIGFLFLIGCSSQSKFVPKHVCSPAALDYVQSADFRLREAPKHQELKEEMILKRQGMQRCYEEYTTRTGEKELRTCLVVGVDEKGRTEFYDFSSQDIEFDQAFYQCSVRVTRPIPFWAFGTNYVLLQTYHFHGQ